MKLNTCKNLLKKIPLLAHFCIWLKITSDTTSWYLRLFLFLLNQVHLSHVQHVLVIQTVIRLMTEWHRNGSSGVQPCQHRDSNLRPFNLFSSLVQLRSHPFSHDLPPSDSSCLKSLEPSSRSQQAHLEQTRSSPGHVHPEIAHSFTSNPTLQGVTRNQLT